MKKILAIMVLFLMANAALAAKTVRHRKPTTASVIAYALADVGRVRSEMLKDDYPRFTEWQRAKYLQITFGNKDYIYNGKRQLIRISKSNSPTAGVIGSYAEVNWELLDKDQKTYSDLFGQHVIHFNGRHWVEVASAGTAEGYGDSLQKAKVPAWVIKRLNLRASADGNNRVLSSAS